jgi:hypothetical protein
MHVYFACIPGGSRRSYDRLLGRHPTAQADNPRLNNSVVANVYTIWA